jgi:membrane associated rhomboid family serine protease
MRPLTERLSPTIRNLVVAESVVFGLFIMARGVRGPIVDHLALGRRLWEGEAWQPLTALFVHTEPWNFFFNLLGLWFVGATIERLVGRWRFLLLFFATGIVSNLVVGGLIGLLRMDISSAGCGDSVLALFVALGVKYGRTPVRVFGQLVLQARILAGILVGMALVSLLMQGAWPLFAGSVVAQVLAYLLVGGNLRPIRAFLAGLQGKPRPGLQVLPGGRGKGGRPFVN